MQNLKTSSQANSKESGVDCPNAILVLLHIQELWMDIMRQTSIYFVFILNYKVDMEAK